MLKIFLILLITIAINSTNSLTPLKPKTYNISLDLAPLDRWRELISENKDGVRNYVDEGLKKYNLSNWSYKVIGKLASLHWDKEFYEELKAISFHSGVELGRIVLLNYIYELNAYCTSIVARHSTGKILHSRNLDYGFRNQIANITFDVNFFSKGELLFKVREKISGSFL